MPLPNDPIYRAATTTTRRAISSTIRAPLTQNSYVARIDHDFGDKQPLLRHLPLHQADEPDHQPGGHRRRAAGRHTSAPGRRRAARRRSPSLLGRRPDHQHHARPSPTISASTTRATSGSGAAPATLPQLPGFGGDVEIGGESTDAPDSLQRQFAERPPALLGRPGQDDQGRSHHDQGQPPDPVRRHRISATSTTTRAPITARASTTRSSTRVTSSNINFRSFTYPVRRCRTAVSRAPAFNT